MSVTITNKAKRMQVFNLPHDQVCSDAEVCKCARITVGVTDHDPMTGDKTVRALKRRIADSFSLTAAGHEGSTVTGLPNAVARLADIKAAVKRGELVVLLEGRDDVEEKAPAPPADSHAEIADADPADHAQAPAAGKE